MDPINESMETHSNQQLHHINQYFLNYRKNISNEEQQISQNYIDSAYSSGYNLTTSNSTPNVSSNLNEALTPQRNNLNIISENLVDSSVNLTPVTQNINRICSFHITTPKSQDFLNTNKNNNKKDIQKIFNIKRSSECLYDFDNFQSTPKKIKINDSDAYLLLNDKSRNSTPLKQKENLKFRQKLHSAPDLDGYFDENLFSPKKLNKISINNNRKPFVNLLSNNWENNHKLTSTPTSSTNKENTDSVNQLLNCSNEQFNILVNPKEKNVNHLKVINESIEYNDFYTDTNFDDLKNNNFSQINTFKPIKINTDANKTPFRRFLSFTTNDTEFKSPKCSSTNIIPQLNSVESTHKSNTSDDEFYLENSFRQYKKQYRVLNTVCSDRHRAKQRANAARLVDLETSFHERSDSKKSQSTDDVKNLTPISLNLKSNDDISIICHREKTTIEDDCISLSAPKRKLSFEDEFIKFEDEDEKDYTVQSIQQNTEPRTPKKIKIFPSNNMQNNNNINLEKFDILYPTIPTTPRKNAIQLSPRRKQHQERKKSEHHNHYKKFYDGAIYLNIITKLESYPVVLDRIFDYLDSYDLLNLTMTTKNHRKIVKGNLIANRKLNQYLNDFQVCKENYGIDKSDIDKERKKSHPQIICNYGKKLPFAQCNTQLDPKKALNIVHLPPVSPSKRKFYENQKVVNTLSENQNISKCPRCAKASRIVNTSLEEAIHNNNNNNNNVFTNKSLNSTILKESFHIPSTAYFVPKKDDEKSAGSSFLTHTQPIQPQILRPKPKLIKSASVDTGLLQIKTKKQQKISFLPFGECMSQSCNFKFCLNCSCEYHPGSKCMQLTISPSKEDVQNGILQLINSPYSKKAIAASRNSKMLRRKSLKRLCF